MKKTLCIASVLATLIGTANATNYQNKIFVGASVDAMSMDSNFKNIDQDEIKYGGSDSSIGGSINAGYKAYFAENGNNSFFITPEIS